MKTHLCYIAFFAFIFLASRPLHSLAGTVAQFRTSEGTILVELYDNEKPITVNNFLNLIKSGAYKNTFFHRADPDFVIQGGGYRVISGSTDQVPNFGPITNEYAVGATYSNIYGTIAMAKVGNDPDSATSEWFFNLADNAAILDHQNGGFTVFGHVIRGLDVLAFFNDTNNYYIVNIGAPFNELPSASTNVYYSDLFYTDISIYHPDLNAVRQLLLQ